MISGEIMNKINKKYFYSRQKRRVLSMLEANKLTSKKNRNKECTP